MTAQDKALEILQRVVAEGRTRVGAVFSPNREMVELGDPEPAMAYATEKGWVMPTHGASGYWTLTKEGYAAGQQ
ncbi:hypothetical protein [Reyranella sp.]|jgi:hypothetical protein|uniref:hypothetical protein n=1 Tax=Reyranella sp. TaxID=1929291 RepID=UPI000BCEE5ED|nr:hypothetical protein [Reyranella sp.]OYY34446.1 MAG: hypothetical protein B7Y57_28070 [Rhodospirillales bacterium 35-66-84]OYZ91014.1 MAG: hypothetical protein B7Y08_27975 [Rhodospirillales bacterium 24-66-33]OZB21510.1 MAG: hypothetical protein B7X63_27070 [Rhodospirillales bacterium 39-66-50]HQS18587.1 hypothetical protein [Reyranella sp.]HQT15408.1 hypothetical protein [Reyranella sp.]